MKWLNKIKSAYDKLDGLVAPVVGLPSYEKYLEHFEKSRHEGRPMSKSEFFRKAQDAKDGQIKCC